MSEDNSFFDGCSPNEDLVIVIDMDQSVENLRIPNDVVEYVEPVIVEVHSPVKLKKICHLDSVVEISSRSIADETDSMPHSFLYEDIMVIDSDSEELDENTLVRPIELIETPLESDVDLPFLNKDDKLSSNTYLSDFSCYEDTINILSDSEECNGKAQQTNKVFEDIELGIEDVELGVAEVYSDYKPVKLTIGHPHPDPVVETSSLSSVEPPEIFFKLSLPAETIESGSLSALQLESIVYASQQHEITLQNNHTAGFLIGDGAGVGKGRTLAGLIFDNYLKGRRKALWFSVCNDLKFDAERDLKDIGANISVHILQSMKYFPITSKENRFVDDGVIFSSYSSLVSATSQKSAYFKTRFEQIVQWCGPDFDGIIVFDECHRSKNICPGKGVKPTKTGIKVVELQNLLPKARVVYASATGASEVRHMAYMVRLGLWGGGTPFLDFDHFRKTVDMRGVGALEIVAMEMKSRGMYLARQLSFQGVSFSIDEVPLTDDFIAAYDKATELWEFLWNCFDNASAFFDSNKMTWCQFWSAHQRFFKYLCISAKVRRAVEIAKKSLEDGKCVVIGLQSTGEASTFEKLEREKDDFTDFICAPIEVLQKLVRKHFPTLENDSRAMEKIIKFKTSTTYSENILGNQPKRKKKVTNLSNKKKGLNLSGFASSVLSNYFNTNKSVNTQYGLKTEFMSDPSSSGDSANEKTDLLSIQRRLISKRDMLLIKIDELGPFLPKNTLDLLIHELGGPECVAEMTGRKGRLMKDSKNIRYEARASESALDAINLEEREAFMNNLKHIAIISEAASSGISLQSDRRVMNKKRRVHITLELPWSADRAIQQFGRTHRSNQVNAPEYIFLISDLAGEKRFASTIAKRLQNLGALTHGDRRATETRDFSSFDVDNSYGRRALDAVLTTVTQYEHCLISLPDEYPPNFLEDAYEALKRVGILNDNIISTQNPSKIVRFLNRLLGIPVNLQNLIFKYFFNTFVDVIKRAIQKDTYDVGIRDFGSAGEHVETIKTLKFYRQYSSGLASVYLHTFHVERGMNFESAAERLAELSGPGEGFYLSKMSYKRPLAVLVEAVVISPYHLNLGSKKQLYIMYKPHLGKQFKQFTLEEIRHNYKPITKEEAIIPWETQFNLSEHMCSHVYMFDNCGTTMSKRYCEIGLRKRTLHVLSGCILNIWPRIEIATNISQMKVVRLRTYDSLKIIGALIHRNCIEALKNELGRDSVRIETILDKSLEKARCY